jgi:AbrB family looped-hinge helix DNA binding protein
MKSSSNVSNGRTVIPSVLRQKLNIQDGDQLIWDTRDGELMVTTRRAQLAKAQALFQSFAPKNSPSAADQLIAERRSAVESE